METKEHSLWVEKYRPDNLDNYVGNETVINTVKQYIDNKDIPHLLFYGKAGGGKTTIAKIIVKAIDCDYIYINASDENNIEVVRDKIKNFASSAGFNPLKIIILDEADHITPQAQAALRNIMETFSGHSRFILTCNYVERLIDPIQSRCQTFNLVPPSKSSVAKRMVQILKNEEKEFAMDDLALVINSAYPDIRKIINSLQQSSMSGTLVIDKKNIIDSSYQLQILELLKSKDVKGAFTESRKVLNATGQTSFIDLYPFLYSNIDKFAEGHIAPVIIILAESQVQEAMAIDKELHAAALIARILLELNS